MAKYRKKPVEIEAVRFMIDDALPDWFMDRVTNNTIITHSDGTCDIKTLEGIMKASKGDYIILGVSGEVYPCKPDIFKKTYDEIVTITEEEIEETLKARQSFDDMIGY